MDFQSLGGPLSAFRGIDHLKPILGTIFQNAPKNLPPRSKDLAYPVQMVVF